MSERKSILVIAQYYYPEPFRVADVCEGLVKRGYEVMVVTSIPNYPEGKVYAGYRNHEHRDEVINGVTVHRCGVIPRKHGTLFRFLNYYSFVVMATRYVQSKKCHPLNGKTFDLVFINETSPIMMAEPAIAYSHKYGTPTVLYTLDLWPESLAAGGIKSKSLIYRYYFHVSKWIYRKMDRILISSKSFKKHLARQFQIDEDSVYYLPQYAEDRFVPNALQANKDTTRLLFAGNVGKIQSLETIVKAAYLLSDSAVIFDIVGSGSDLRRIQELVNDLKIENVIFYGRRDVSEMPEFYAKADAMLVTLAADPLISMTLPGKVQSYMAAGKPIIGAIDGEAAKVISDANCGYCGPAEDVASLVKNIRLFIQNNNAKILGTNARNFYETYFSKDQFFQKLTNVIEQVK
ncbi:glycosyltransferase family 4 protein [Limosilactobacillus fermentum]|uniref:glycosyltransferase family 4 protein n=1 Tax=Lactobacillaceae TaxID=33958 RepID=UPI0030EB5EBB